MGTIEDGCLEAVQLQQNYSLKKKKEKKGGTKKNEIEQQLSFWWRKHL